QYAVLHSRSDSFPTRRSSDLGWCAHGPPQWPPGARSAQWHQPYGPAPPAPDHRHSPYSCSSCVAAQKIDKVLQRDDHERLGNILVVRLQDQCRHRRLQHRAAIRVVLRLRHSLLVPPVPDTKVLARLRLHHGRNPDLVAHDHVALVLLAGQAEAISLQSTLADILHDGCRESRAIAPVLRILLSYAH